MNPSDHKPSDYKAFRSLLSPLVLVSMGMFMVFSDTTYIYWLGQFSLSLFFVQTFFLLHECGHLNFFKTRVLNKGFGNLFGFFTLIPFDSWQHVHGLHHRWAGWRDMDPTTEPTAHASKSKAKNIVVNIAWKLFIPLFYLAYKIGNYWNLKKIRKYLNEKKYSKVKSAVFVYGFVYLLIFIFFGRWILVFLLPGFLLSLLWKEMVIMSQHSHVDMPLAEGKKVKPFSYLDQVQYTRSFHVPSWISEYFLFNVNLHEAHHAYPGVPSYELSQIDIGEPDEPKFLDWLSKAKSMKGEDYVFRTSKHTGKKF